MEKLNTSTGRIHAIVLKENRLLPLHNLDIRASAFPRCYKQVQCRVLEETENGTQLIRDQS